MENSNLEQSSDDSVDVMTVENTVLEALVEEEAAKIEKSINSELDPYLKTEKSIDSALDPSLKIPKIDYEDIGEFCFESDILALKGNNDYKNVLEAIVILEAQRDQAVKDLCTLRELKEEALADPFAFVEKLKNKEDMNMPTAQRIHPVPSIDWGKYALSGDPSAFKRRQLTKIAADIKKNLKRKLSNPVDVQENEAGFWSSEEEKQLEELLMKFPPERNQLARWEKIANCLKNHTASQVAVKAQKCFANLIENSVFSETNSVNHSKKIDVGVRTQICDEEKHDYQSSLRADEDSLDSKIDVSDDDEIDPVLHDTAEYQELLLYKKLLKKRIKSSTMIQHLGFKCVWCKSEPILGVRYHCIDCNPDSVDFCEDCIGGAYDIDQHTSDHQFEEIHHSNAGFLDRDYMHFLGNDYNYLDPNYMPAT